MLEHADRDDAVEMSHHLPVIAQQELDPVPKLGLLGATLRDLELLLGKRDAGHLHIGLARQRQRQAAPAAADIQHLHARL